jgi:hypothetical protein
MKISCLIAIAAAVLFTAPVSAQSPQYAVWGVDAGNNLFRWNGSAGEFERMPGSLKQVSVGTDGEVWGVDLGDNIQRWTRSQWQQVPGNLQQLSVRNAQEVWGVGAANNLSRWNGSTWEPIPGQFEYVSVGGDGTVWAVNANDDVLRRDGSDWTVIPGQKFKRISVTDAQRVWGIDADAHLWRWTGTGWENAVGEYLDVAQAPDGELWRVYINGTIHFNPVPTGPTQRMQYSLSLKKIAVGSTDVVSVSQLNLFSSPQQAPPIITGTVAINPMPQDIRNLVDTPLTVQPPVSSGPAPVLVQGPEPAAGGTRLCVTTTAQCGLTKADWVGKHTLNTTCDVGFYDMLWGGTCWQAPVDDGKGTWVRSADPVDRDTAFWRAPVESTAAATKVKDRAAAWECPSGSFWDGYDWGTCWTCPDAFPRRTAAAVWALNACATSMNETAKARFVGYNGCPKPDRTAMGLTGKRMPGKPFLDIAGGGCYACPTADDDGNILVTERNANRIYGDNQGCTIKYKWKPNPYPEPGLAGLDGVREILAENLVFDDPNVLTAYLAEVATERGLAQGTPAAEQFVAAQWQDIARDPYKNAQLSALVYKYLEEAAQKEPPPPPPGTVVIPPPPPPPGTGASTTTTVLTAAEQRLVQAFEAYVQKRRTFIAQQALAMYDDWKAFIDSGGDRYKGPLESAFDFGTVPWDFQSAATSGLGLGALGLGVVGTAVAEQAHFVPTAKIIEDAIDKAKAAGQTAKDIENTYLTIIRDQSLYKGLSSLKNFNLLATGSKFGIVAGPAVIDAAFAVVTSIAIDQFIQIQEARSKLEAAIAEAEKPVNLKSLLAETNGRDQLAFFWAKATDASQNVINLDNTLRAKAAVADRLAAQRGYQLSGP